MSVKIMNMVFDRYPRGGSEFALALALADHAHDDGTHIWPSVAKLAHKSKQSERSVQRTLAAMVKTGWLVVAKRASGRPGDTNIYNINPAWLAGSDLPQTGDSLSPVPPVDKPPDHCGQVIHTGDNRGETGDTAMSPESSGTTKVLPPISPVDTGDCGKLSPPTAAPRTSETAGQPKQPSPVKAGRRPWRWRESRPGIEATAKHLGMAPWDDSWLRTGQGENFLEYTERVRQAYDALYPSVAQARAKKREPELC